jgi:hypothetical protein
MLPARMRVWLAVPPLLLLAACGANSVCKLAAGINDPSNRTMRRQLMSYGLGQFCTQMTTRNAPLKLAPDQPVSGRFYPQHCTQQTLANGDLWVQFDGIGYAYTPMSRKVTFTSGAQVQYDQDFKCASDDSIYAYFVTRNAGPPTFQIVQIEAPLANLMEGWIGPYANNYGTQMVAGQLAQGFTVIQGSDGSVDFDEGHLAIGQKPQHPFDVHGKDRVRVESERTQVYPGERDFIGPITVQDAKRALYLTMQLDGQQAINVLLLPKAQGDQALQRYVQAGPAAPLTSPPQFSDVLQYGVQYQRAVPIVAGMYYVVIDNTSSPGQAVAPAALPLGAGGQAAVVSYEIQIGDAQ